MSIRKTFVLSDESVENSYGFTILHKGADIETRFKPNPVMLDLHRNHNRSVLGRWLDPRFKGTQMLGETDFDMDDDDVKPIARKVEKDYIKGASLGIIFDPVHLVLTKEGKLVLEKCTVIEASICPVPSNGNSISLYNTKGELLDETEIRTLCLSAKKTNPIENKNPKKMSKLTLSALAVAALVGAGVKDTDDENAVSAGIEKLHADLATANADLKALKEDKKRLQDEQAERTEKDAKALLAAAVAEGKITPAEEVSMLPDAIANLSFVTTYLAKVPAKKTLGGTITTPEGGDDKNKERESWTLSDWRDKDPKGLELMFDNEPEKYAKLKV